MNRYERRKHASRQRRKREVRIVKLGLIPETRAADPLAALDERLHQSPTIVLTTKGIFPTDRGMTHDEVVESAAKNQVQTLVFVAGPEANRAYLLFDSELQGDVQTAVNEIQNPYAAGVHPNWLRGLLQNAINNHQLTPTEAVRILAYEEMCQGDSN